MKASRKKKRRIVKISIHSNITCLKIHAASKRSASTLFESFKKSTLQIDFSQKRKSTIDLNETNRFSIEFISFNEENSPFQNKPPHLRQHTVAFQPRLKPSGHRPSGRGLHRTKPITSTNTATRAVAQNGRNTVDPSWCNSVGMAAGVCCNAASKAGLCAKSSGHQPTHMTDPPAVRLPTGFGWQGSNVRG